MGVRRQLENTNQKEAKLVHGVGEHDRDEVMVDINDDKYDADEGCVVPIKTAVAA